MFKIGDTVQLKSGGPSMVVDEVDKSQAHCVWFSGSTHKGSWFEMAVLREIPETGPVAFTVTRSGGPRQ